MKGKIGATERVVISLFLSFALAGKSFAAPFSTDGMTLDIPPGFTGPVTQTHQEGRLFAFTKQSSVQSVQTLLQITIVEPPANAIPTTLTNDELSIGSEKYLRDFLQGVERRRTEFVQGPVVHLLIAGIPSAKISWKGNAQGAAVNGVMYCLVAKGKIFQFHTQDIGAEPTGNMREAAKAIESLAMK